MFECSDNKPTGKEKDLIKWFRKQFGWGKPVLDELSVYIPGLPQIEIDHALGGTRVNGWSSTVTALNIYRKLKEHKREVDETYNDIARYRKKFNRIFEQVKRRMARFPICPVCHGHKHESKLNNYCDESKCEKKQSGRWKDCYHCGGRGVIEL